MKNMLCSFIIPAYNASSTIVRCLDSIYKLSLNESEFEVICIDDCSTDNTVIIIEEYAKYHSNITLLCQLKNHRQGAARNRGVDIAKGEYIVFVDSDDESDSGVVDAIRIAEKENLDMVAMHYVNIDENGNMTDKEPINFETVFTGIELQTNQPYWCTGPVPYLYRSTLLKSVSYPFYEDVLFEDSDFVNVHLYHAKRIRYCSACSYKVHYNSTSTTHTTSYKHVADYFLLGTRMLHFYHTLDDKESKYALSIKEGGSYNIWVSCKRLVKLPSIKDAKLFYDRVDFYADRTKLYAYKEPTYCWTFWTKLCIKHKHVAIALAFMGQLGYKTMKRLSGK